VSAPATTHSKRERLEARVPAEIKSLAEHAATISGLSLTDLIIQSIKTYSEGIIERDKIIRLTARDSMIFADVVLNRTEPNEALQNAAQRYRDLFGDLP
jgi:uncharacterized protein (DUF1778 family)